jgi:hypothetical protein
MAESERSLPAWFSFAALALLTLLNFADVLIGSKTLFDGDTGQYNFPLKKAVRDVMRGGEFPLWDRLRNEGQPMAENPAYEVFYPPQWLTWIGDYVTTFNLHILLHLPLAAIGMFMLLRGRGSSVGTAAFGAVTFALAGPMLSCLRLPAILFAWAWLPWIAYFVPRHPFLAAICVAMQCFIGEPFSMLQTLILVLVLTRRVFRTIVVYAWGAALAAVQLIPMLAFTPRTIRARGFTFEHVASFSLDPARIADLFFPSAAPHAYIDQLYCGFAVVVLCVIGFAKRVSGWKTTAALAIGAFIVAIGDHTPLLGLLYDAHIFRSIRYPEKLVMMMTFALIVFAATTLDRFSRYVASRGDPQVATWVVSFIAWVALLFALVDLGYQARDFVPRTTPHFFDAPPMVAQIRDRVYNENANERETTAATHVAQQWEKRNDLYPLFPEAWNRAFAIGYDYDETELFATHVFRAAAERAQAQHDPNWPELYMAMSASNSRIVGDDEHAAIARLTPETLSAAHVVPSAQPNPRYYLAERFVPATQLFGVPHSSRTVFVRGAAFQPASGNVTKVVEHANSAEIDVDANGPTLLVACVTFDRNWRATIDGRPTHVAQVNISHQGIVIPPGKHHVSLRYRSRELIAGAIVSVLAALASAAAVAASRRSRGMVPAREQ